MVRVSCQGCSHDETAPPAPTPTAGGPAGPTPGQRTRDFDGTWDTSATVPAPMGGRNPGHVHNVISTNGQWARGELPDMGYGYAFALARPRFMREPRTDIGSYNLAQG